MAEKTENIPIVIVAGMGKNTRAIGKENGLLWHVPDDLKRFKALSMGHPIIMGRKTFESILAILGKPFPGRTNIVVTRNKDYTHDGVIIVDSFERALEEARKLNPKEIHIGGGSELYIQALPYVTKLFITLYFDEKEGDTFFPPFEEEFAQVASHSIREYNGIKYEWVDYERKK